MSTHPHPDTLNHKQNDQDPQWTPSAAYKTVCVEEECVRKLVEPLLQTNETYNADWDFDRV